MQEPSYVVDASEFEEMYLREYPGLYAVAAALAGIDNGDDIVQDTMFKALIHWPRVRGLDRPGGWCHRVLVNLCRSFWRRRRLEDRFAAKYLSKSPSASGPSEDIVAFWSAVRRLPTRLAKIVNEMDPTLDLTSANLRAAIHNFDGASILQFGPMACGRIDPGPMPSSGTAGCAQYAGVFQFVGGEWVAIADGRNGKLLGYTGIVDVDADLFPKLE